MVDLVYVNIFASDLDALSGFYANLFDLKEIVSSRSPLFRGYKAGECSLGFSGYAAHPLLGLDDNHAGEGKVFITFGAPDRLTLDHLTAAAVARGGALVKAPFETYYGSYQSVLRDPEGNVFRINHA